jgi:outer membrane protein TolC
MRLRTSVVLAAWAWVATPLAAQAPASLRLSFADAVRRAAEAPAVAIATLRIDEAGANVREARGAFLPGLKVTAGWLNRKYNAQGFFPNLPPTFPQVVGPFNNYDGRASATQTLFDLSGFSRIKAAQAFERSSGADRTVAVEGATQAAALAYLTAVRATASVAARQADSGIAAELVHLAVEQRAAGVSAAIDVTRARTQLVVAEGQLVVARNQRDRATLDLGRVLGLDPAVPLELSDTLTSGLGQANVSLNLDSAVAAATAARPDLVAEQARGEAARRSSASISNERLPRLDLQGDYGWNGITVPGALPTGQIAVQVTIPLLDGLRREARIAEQRAIADESDIRARDLRNQIGAEVRAAFLDAQSAQAQQAIAAERLRLAEDELAQARERFRAGVAGNIEVINAQSSLVQARDADIDARYSAAAARVALARAVGVAHTLH